MKNKNLKSLALNKTSISQFDQEKGGGPIGAPTLSTCSCYTCVIENCQASFPVCPPPQTQFCTVECQTLDCTFVTNCLTIFCGNLP